MNPDEMSDAAAGLAAVGQLADAEGLLRKVLSENASHLNARKNLAVVLLAQGRYVEAEPYYRDRHLAGGSPRPRFGFPEWRGEDLTGKRLVVFPEQGLGDQIAFSRFARALANDGVDVTLLCSASLERLFRASFDFEVLAAEGSVSFADPDYWCTSNDLLVNTRTDPASLPQPPYLRVAARGRGGIGVKTRGNPGQTHDQTRSLPDELAAELLSLPGAIDLDPESTGARDFQETAEIVAGLDLVISVCTSVAHLAGALAKPVWVMLPAAHTYWLWMRGRADSPWYPTARLFRQPSPGDWSDVVRRVMAEFQR